MLAFQVIDLIKRGFIDGVYDGEEWYFELSPERIDSPIDSGDAGKKSNRMFSAQNAGLDLADVELLKQRFGAKGSEELRAIIRDVNGDFWREEAREAALHLLQSRRKSNE